MSKKSFNFIKRFDKGDMEAALERATTVLGKRTEYIKAMNLLVADKDEAYVASFFNEDPEYSTIHTKTNGVVIVCSEPYPAAKAWCGQDRQVIPMSDFFEAEKAFSFEVYPKRERVFVRGKGARMWDDQGRSTSTASPATAFPTLDMSIQRW
jgi:hypothetical protein